MKDHEFEKVETRAKQSTNFFFLTVFQVSATPRLVQMDLIAELKRRQVSPLMREGKDGTIEDIITGRGQK